MLNIEECRNILKNNDLKLDDSQIKDVREFLYAIAHIALNTENNNDNLIAEEKYEK